MESRYAYSIKFKDGSEYSDSEPEDLWENESELEQNLMDTIDNIEYASVWVQDE